MKADYGDTFAKLQRSPFMREQFDLFQETLKAMKPKVVVVANAGASDFAVEGLRLTSQHDGRTYRWSEMSEVPIFLSGMLSGQRALDTYSRERLEFNVRVALQAGRV